MHDLSQLFARNSKDVMSAKKLTIGDVVSQNGLSQSTVYRMLRGNSEPTLSNALAMAEALGVTLNRLIKA